MAINKEKKVNIIKKFGKSEKDTGNINVQIALLTDEISLLTEHLKNNKKDFNSKRSLNKKNSKRHSLLRYLKNKDINQYRDLVKKLNLRAQ